MTIHSVAVLGAGVMGAQIAAHFANAGVPALLMDLTEEAAAAGLKRARSLSPDPFFTPDAWRLVETMSFEKGLPRLSEADWIIEAIVERLEAKVELLAKVDAAKAPHAIVSSNTSGIPIAALAEGRSAGFKQHWLGTHFFNPPRYLRLLEVIPTAETDPAAVSRVRAFADERLGKGVVIAKDSPNFIGNHLALFEVTRILAAVAAGSYSIEEVDAIAGPAIGRPKSATFRTLDLAGLDILAHVIENLRQRLPVHEATAFGIPPFVERMLAAGLTGEKAGRGFYQRVKDADGRSEILVIDPATLEYGPQEPAKLGALAAAEPVSDLGARVARLFKGNDRVGAFLREILAPTLLYAARIAPDVAHSPDDVDRVMQWGFGWERGPFELLDALGICEVLEAVRQTAPSLLEHGVPPLLQDALAAGRNRLREALVPPAAPDLQVLRSAKDRSRVVKSNPGASLVDVGDGVLTVEFHSKMNTIGGDALAMLRQGAQEAAQSFAALVVGNDALHFSAGANLMLVLLEAQDENWDELDAMVREFQKTATMLRCCDVPVVVAPAGLALGGACELALQADRVQAAAETYMGLVEVGVGLIPAGGGTKEMTARAAARAAGGDLLPHAQHAFETIGFGRTSASGPDAVRLGYMRAVDGITMNRERLMADAKAKALQRVKEGYQPPRLRAAIPVGGETVLAPLKLGVHLAWRAGRISDHDALIGRKLATVIAGGADLPFATTVSEQRLFDLEREAFLSLLGEPKTQQRIQHMLKTGKPLRN
jgi:3-hydroxyacyl-CoA dehydrogenase